MNKALFKSTMRAKGYHYKTLAPLLGLSQTSLRAKLNGGYISGGAKSAGACFSQVEIQKLIELWGLTAEQTFAIFFNAPMAFDYASGLAYIQSCINAMQGAKHCTDQGANNGL